jgi:hypothetical protein
MIRIFRFCALLCAGLGLGPGAAHVLELAPKMRYDAEMYMAVTSTLYQYFGSAGAVLQIGTILLTAALALMLRHRAAFRPTLVATLGFALSVTLWAVLVAPVNVEWFEVMTAAPAAAADAYVRLRPRWEFGHVMAFVVWLLGFGALVFSVLMETSSHGRRDRRA